MIFKKVNFLFEVFSRKDLNMSTHEFLTSAELQEELTNIFGEQFYSKTLCHQVCRKVAELADDDRVQTKTDIQVFLKIDGDLEPISIKGHCVVQYNNTIYDYTSDQYVYNGVQPVKGLRILTQENDIPIPEDMEIGQAQVFSNEDYVIFVNS